MVLTPTPRKEGEAQTGTKVEVEEREGAKASLGLKTTATPQHKMLILNKTICHTPPYPQPFYPMPPMSYAQVVQNPPPPLQNTKGGKGKGQNGKGHMAGRGGGQQIVAPPPNQGSSTNYMGGKNTPWAGNCGFCYNSQRAYTHDHRTCPHNPRNAGQGKVGGRGTPLPQAQSAVAPPTNV